MEKNYAFNITKEIPKYELTEDEERALYPYLNDENEEVKRWAREKVYNANLKLVLDRVNAHRVNNISFDDCFDAGCLGMWKAMDKFDPETGNRFGTYAWCDIEAALSRFIKEEMTKNNLSEDCTNKVLRVKRVIKDLSEDLNKDENEISEEEVRESIKAKNIRNIPLNQLGELMKMSQNMSSVSIDASTSEEEENNGLLNIIPDSDDFVKEVNNKIDAERLWKELKNILGEREVMILWMVWKEGRKLEEVGTLLNMTKQNVSIIQKKVFAILKNNPVIKEFKESIMH